MAPRKSTSKATDIETEQEYSLNQIASVFAEGFVSNMFGDGIVKEVSTKQLYDYLSDPDSYIKEISNLSQYYYITTGEVFQLFELTRSLPTLNYRILATDKTKDYEKNIAKCNKILKKIKHKQLTRDIISQLISTGTLTGIWIGKKSDPYLYLFERPDKVFPAFRLNGDWVIQLDLSWLDELSEYERTILYKNLDPHLTEQIYRDYKVDNSKRYIDLPQNRTICLRTHTLSRNQKFGTSWATTGLFDLQHKKKMKDLEKAVANKIISAVAVLKIGSEKNLEYANLKLNKTMKKKIHSGVKEALEKNQSQGVTVVTIPEFANLEFPEMKSDALEPKKFESINNDISASYGVSTALTNGTTSNNSAAKINLDILYKRIGILLEDIENEVYAKLFQIVLPVSVADDYQMEYDKEAPLTLKEKSDILMKLHVQEGFSLKAVIDTVPGIEFAEYINQSTYEQEELKLQERIKPYQSSFTNTVDNSDAGRPEVEDADKQGNPSE